MNIGPFKGQALTCFFPQGKYLIKAPIGSGKSFLFFDGPMFGLYKLANRNMLNALSKEGYIKILFEINGETYLIVRNLKAGKSKDSCSSTWFKLNGEIEDGRLKIEDWREKNGHGIVTKDIDIEKVLKELKVPLEEIPFKNETDLQQTLQGILQPKEVFLNTVFLMQDSDNIFQLAPAERLSVLKNVFNLLAIDEGKDIIAEKKREVNYKLKATADTSKYDMKLQQVLTRYSDTFTTLLGFGNYGDLQTVVDKKIYHDFLSDIDLIKEKITITDFSLDNFPAHLVMDLESWLSAYQNDFNVLEQKRQLISKEYEKSIASTSDAKKKINELEQSIQAIDKKISGLDPVKIKSLKAEKTSIQENQESLEDKLPRKQCADFYAKRKKELDFSFLENEKDIHVGDLSLFVHSLISFGKNANEKLQNLDLQIKHQELLINQQKSSLEQEIKSKEEKVKDLHGQETRLDEKIYLFEQDEEQQATFACEKVGSNCPFIKVINKQHFEKLAEQKKRFLDEKAALDKNIKEATLLLKKKTDELENFISLQKESKEIQNIKKQQEIIQSLIAEIKDFLTELDYKGLQVQFTMHQENENKMKLLDREISSLEEMLRQAEELSLQKEKYAMQITTLQESLAQATKEQAEQQKEIAVITEKIQALEPERLQSVKKLIITLKEVGRDVLVLITEFKDVQIEVKALQEEEKVLGELYNIFAKELLLLVLQDSLPVLNDIINNYLTQVVDYQIKFELAQTSTDKPELAVTIIDERGTREIKSLSGGQMIILKLVRMLSISSYIHSPILFLDETINNLDTETVGKVADLLEDFVQSRDMKLYTVTHSQQIQNMDIWDEVIEVGGWS